MPKTPALLIKPAIFERDGSLVECHSRDELSVQKNWGKNVDFEPRFTFVPKSKEGICNVVKWATREKLRIRAAGYRHTWNHVYSDDDTVLISLLGLDHVASDRSATADPNGTGAGKELRGIEFVKGCTENDKIYCKIGGAVTNDELRQYCLDNSDPFTHKQWTMPLNFILVENTFSGTVSSICHGAGAHNKTVSDLVVEIEFVNAKGELQTISATKDPELMKAAAGSLGLLGIITSITLKLDRMGYALTHPEKLYLAKAIPPLHGTQLKNLPKKLQESLHLHGHTNNKKQEHLDAIIANNTQQFFDRCKNDYYTEWFWFILDSKCWINTWSKDSPSNDNKNKEHWERGGGRELDKLQAGFQNVMSSFAALFNKEGDRMPNPPFQESFVKTANGMLMGFLPTTKRTIPVYEALHFQRGIRHIHARDVEIEIPIPMVNNEPDWSICQRAWWDAIGIIYEKLGEDQTLPVNLTVEMRIMGGSDIPMAPQYKNNYTCSIEVLSSMLVPENEWKAMVERIIAKWLTYKDLKDKNGELIYEDENGKPINIRTHWGKEWDTLKFAKEDAHTFVKKTHKDVIPEFKQRLEKIGAKASTAYTLDDVQRTFSNQLWDDIIFNKPLTFSPGISTDEQSTGPRGNTKAYTTKSSNVSEQAAGKRKGHEGEKSGKKQKTS